MVRQCILSVALDFSSLVSISQLSFQSALPKLYFKQIMKESVILIEKDIFMKLIISSTSVIIDFDTSYCLNWLYTTHFLCKSFVKAKGLRTNVVKLSVFAQTTVGYILLQSCALDKWRLLQWLQQSILPLMQLQTLMMWLSCSR